MLAPALLVAGAVVGAASTLAHGRTWGLLLALVATAATAVALPPGWHTRSAFALGWVVVVLYGTRPTDSGGYLVAGDVRGYLLLLLGLVLVLHAVVTVRPRGGPAPEQEPSRGHPHLG